jgi:hypothetical protein
MNRQHRSPIQSDALYLATAAAAVSSIGGHVPAQDTQPPPRRHAEVCCATQQTGYGTDGCYSTNTWPGGNVYYQFDAAVTPTQRQRMLDAWAAISSESNIQFIPWSGQGNWITVVQDPAMSFSSHIGMKQPPESGEQTIGILTPDMWNYPGVLMHETMHALGLQHEHQREDRDTYIVVDPALLPPNPPNSDYVIRAWPAYNAHLYGGYDFASLMHYSQAFGGGVTDRAITVRQPWRRAWQWRIGTFVGPQARLSAGDRRVLYQMYPGPIAPPPGDFALLQPSPGALVGPVWTPSFAWGPSQDAVSYRLQVDDTPAFVSPEIDVVLPASQTAYTHPVALDSQRIYWWRVLASNTGGEVEPNLLPSHTLYTSSVFPATLYVDDTAPAGGDGATWNTALRELGAALEIAHASDGVTTEIRVAQGVYTPDFGSGLRSLSFELPRDCAVRGGYAGHGAANPDARDIEQYETILSGDLNGDDGAGFVNTDDNSSHVVMAVSVTGSTLLEGFTIRGGNARREGWPAAMGGGAIVDGPAVFRRCVFTNNHADDNGGAVGVFFQGADPRFQECIFRNNRARAASMNLGRVYGGGALTVFKAGGRYINCTFDGNSAFAGGAASINFGEPKFINCLFTGNDATAPGPFFVGGGALLGTNGSQSTLVNCTVVGNLSTASGGGIRNNGASSGNIANSIVWSNSPNQLTGTASISYSNVQGGASGPAGNINQPPVFTAAGAHPYALADGSPGIDAGSNLLVTPGITTDLAGRPRFIEDPCTTNTGLGTPPLVDMGAYEHRHYPDCDFDGVLTIADFGCFLTKFALNDPYADCNGDGILGLADFGCFQTGFAVGCP